MKQTGILYSPDMIQAILDLIKKVTLRLRGLEKINADPDSWECARFHDGVAKFCEKHNYINEQYIKCPYGKVGDVLYAREAYYQYGHWEEIPGVKTKTGKQKWKFVPDSKEILFEAPVEYRKGRHHKDPYTPAWHKRLARFMPKEYARIWLEVTGLCVEKVRDITEEQAMLEGAMLGIFREGPNTLKKEYHLELNNHARYREGFKYIWHQINGRESWDNNDWVFAISFKVLSTTGKPDNL